MAKSQPQTNPAAKGKKGALNIKQQEQEIEDDLLIKAFTNLFPCLTKSVVADDYLDHLLAKNVLDFESMKEIQSKAAPKEKAREMLSQVCKKKGGCKVMLDLFIDKDINQQDLHDKVLTEYKNLAKRSLKEKVTDTLETLNKLQIKNEPTASEESTTAEQNSTRKDAFGKYVEFRVCIVNFSASSETPSTKDIFSHLKKQQRLKEDLQCFLRDFDRKDGSWLSFVSLNTPLVVATNDFEWEELSPLLTGLSSGDWRGFIQEISLKPFASEGQKKEFTDQLSCQKKSGATANQSGNGKKKGGKSQTPSAVTTSGSEFPMRQDNEDQSQASRVKASSLALSRSVSQGDTGGKTPNTPAVPTDLLQILRQVKFGVGKESRKRASEVMNSVGRRVVESLKEQYRLVLRPEFSGSSFEGAKIEAANEFDMLIILDGKDLDRVEYNPQFFTLLPRKADNPKFKEFLSNTGTVDPEKITSKLFSWVQLVLNSLFPVGSEYIVKVRRTGPAVTLLIESNPKCPAYQPDLGKIDVDLVATFEVLKEQFVAKPYQVPNPENKPIPDITKTTRYLWRKSFSLLEKERLHGIDKDGGCRRQCLRLFKCIRLRDSLFKRLASYHYKILLLNECEKFQEREDWVADKLAERFWGLISSLRRYLEDGNLPHCIDNRINIFERMTPIVLNNMKGRVKKIMNKGSIELKNIFDKDQIK